MKPTMESRIHFEHQTFMPSSSVLSELANDLSLQTDEVVSLRFTSWMHHLMRSASRVI